MPTYEFRCPDGSIIERVFKMSEVPESIPTPDGSGVAVRMISGGADLLFKGSGFYITDYGKDGKKDQRESANKSAAGEGAKASSSEGTKSSAPAAAPSSSSASDS
jgi:predicted nucleic acid-binding Zn ribbon protein